MRKKLTLVLFGACLITGGLLYFVNELGLISLSFSAWWTLFLIVPALADMLVRKVQIWNSMLFVLGLWFFLREQNWEWLDDKILDALAITLAAAALGTLLIARGLRGKEPSARAPTPTPTLPDDPGYSPQRNPTTDSMPRPSYSAVFSGSEYRNVCPALENVQAAGVFGGLDVDLTGAGLCHGAVINVTAFFGGVTMRMPQNVNVQFQGTSPFGGIENHLTGGFDPNLPTVQVKYFAMFGGTTFRY